MHRHQGFPDDLQTTRAPAESRQPEARRPLYRKLLLAGLCILTIVVFCVVMLVPFITFTYTGAFSEYLDAGGFESRNGKKTLSRNLFQFCGELFLDMTPESLADWYAIRLSPTPLMFQHQHVNSLTTKLST